MTAVVESLSSKQALKLWELLRQHFQNAQRVVEEIIELRAWEPLGYESFSEAWNAQMRDITLATEVRPHVAYQLFAEGLSVDEVARSIKGLGEVSAESLKRQRNNGVPADMALVREHLRQSPRRHSVIHLDIGADMLERYQKIAARLDSTVNEIALQAVKERFAELRSAL